jgi:hypothetical protein
MSPKLLFRVLIASVLTVALVSWYIQRPPAAKPMSECGDGVCSKEQKAKELHADFPMWESLSRHLIAIQK